MQAPIDWLLEGPAWIEVRVRQDLLGASARDASVQTARRAMLADPAVRQIVTGLSDWPGKVIASHRSASQPFHRLSFLAELGWKANDPGMDAIVTRILAHPAAEGPFQLPMNIPEAHGGTGQERWAWALCDAPLILFALARMGLAEDPAVRRGVTHLVGLVRTNGWPCAVSKELGKFRGPGRKDDPCPFATLAMLKALAAFPDLDSSPACRSGAEALLALWQESASRHPYMFFMGTDFRKLKVPFVWYDLLHVLEVLSHFPWLRADPRLQDMRAVLVSRMDPQGRFTPESVWEAWKGWEFGQKKQPSRWLTLLAWRIMLRLESAPP